MICASFLEALGMAFRAEKWSHKAFGSMLFNMLIEYSALK
jgi:hypothetical protein